MPNEFMFGNYIKTTLRSLLKNKTYSFLNVFGLAVGIACAALIFLWVEDEKSFDSNHLKKDRLYLVKMNSDVDGGVFTHSSTPALMAPAMKGDIPGIANSCRVSEGGTALLFNIGNKTMYAAGNYADSAIFSMFTLPFEDGSPAKVFSQLNAIVLTAKTAEKFFGTAENIIGKTVLVDGSQEFVVAGVLKNLPENSSLQFEWLIPFQTYEAKYPGAQQWGNFGLTTYVELKSGASARSIDAQLRDYIQKKQGSSTSTAHAFLFGMNDWRLYDDFENGKQSGKGRIQYVHLFSVIAWIILLIACINFMNLATARSEKRSREVGVRKVLGSGKTRLVIQFLADAVFLAVLAGIAAVIMVSILLPAFNGLVQKNLSPGFGDPVHWLALVALVLICGLVAGSYPALYLSSFNPVYVLKGIKIKSGSAALIRKGLVVLQFTVSIVLIVGTIVIYQQIQHVKTRNLGYSRDNLIQMRVQGDMLKNFDVIKQDMLNTGVVQQAALADHETIEGGNNTTNFSWQGKDPGSTIVISIRLVSPEFISTVGMHVQEGRDFTATDVYELFNADRSIRFPTSPLNVIISESMERTMGKGSAIGKMLLRQTPDGAVNLRVVGVIHDYIYGNMYINSSPVVFLCIPQATNLLYLRIKPAADPEKNLAALEAVMKKDNPAYPFEFQFVDDQFNAKFMSETLISKLSRVFAALAIIISCLGLFGLAAYTAERRTKEVGIRKVLGASVTGISTLLSKDFLKLVGISCVIAFPVSWWMMHDWLQNYEYRIQISGWIFLAAGVLAIAIALTTVSLQAIRAALANPVESLRSE